MGHVVGRTLVFGTLGACWFALSGCSKPYQTAFKVGFAVGSAISLLSAYSFYHGITSLKDQKYQSGSEALIVCFIPPICVCIGSFFFAVLQLVLKVLAEGNNPESAISLALSHSISAMGGVMVGSFFGGFTGFGIALMASAGGR